VKIYYELKKMKKILKIFLLIFFIFSLVFEALPTSSKVIDIIEDENGNNFDFYRGVIDQNLNSVKNFDDCDRIIFEPVSPKTSLDEFFAGVKYFRIISLPKINGHIPAYNALYKYLEAMRFKMVTKEYKAESLCEEMWVDISFDYISMNKFYNIKWIFTSPCADYKWELSTSKTAGDGMYSNPESNFYSVLRSMYPHYKPNFNSQYTIQLPKRRTCWTEYKFKNYSKNNGLDNIEGIYENSFETNQMPKYKVAVKKIGAIYHIIYLSGATNFRDWSEGEIKAVLEPTASPFLFKTKWYMSNKSLNDDSYISFEDRIFSLILNGQKDVYVKLFPSFTDVIKNTSKELSSSGTGWALSSNGFIVTNHHVIEGGKSIKIRGINNDFSKSYNAIVINEDKNNDLAILKVDDPKFTNLGTIPYTIFSKTIDVGSSIFVLGYPLRATMGDEVKLTNGIISSRTGFQGDITSYQVSAPVQAGNSGGPMFDSNGNVIGIINAKHLGAENASYAIKVSYLLNLVDLINEPISLPKVNLVSGKPLTEQIKILQKFTYIIEVN
jgi:S1-C subfamily serine protease